MTANSDSKSEAELWVDFSGMRETAAGEEGTLQLTSVAANRASTRVSDEMLAGMGETLQKVCQLVSGAFQAANRPDELVVKFGLKVGVKGGTNVFLLTEANGEATLAIEAKWTNPKPVVGGMK